MTEQPKMTDEELAAFYASRRRKNWVLLGILTGLAVLFFVITILKMSG
ncbi:MULTISPECIES: hypothetical protein [unclassified Thalassospira]|jgi:hypothetical protein|nr:hypothetical protein [Thalassospira sp. MCCC 1A01428]